MSSENENGLSPRSPDGNIMSESDPKKPRIRYTRDFLLSFCGLYVCKKLPSGFDQSLLSELEEAANSSFDRQRSLGSSSLQGLRWGEYGSQTMDRSESYTRGSSGRWDTRSTGSSDRDGDLHSDRESFVHDSGRRFGSQSRHVPQHAEHDGLLGSCAIARPSGYFGAPPPKSRGNGHSQLTRTAAPYKPPRPYKATPYSLKDNNDSCDDETFNSTECSSQDRAEEERKRRESFEFMRKEQKKGPQEKQEHNKDSPKENLVMDIMTLLQNSDTYKSTKSGSKPDESASSSSHIHVPAAGPLVPPGFAGALIREKNHQMHFPGTVHALQNHGIRAEDEARNHLVAASSKFAHLFLEESEGKNHMENISSRDLLSLIVSNDVGSQVCTSSNDESIKQMQSSLPSESNDTASRLLTSPPSSMSRIHINFNEIDRTSPCAVLTCEDLEQSILAEIEDSGSSSQFSQGSLAIIDGNSQKHKDAVDNNASQHLLALLQMGSNSKDSLSSAIPAVTGRSETLTTPEDNLQAADSGTGHTSEKHLTLEALFGVAFMNELHSTEAPISSQRSSNGSVDNDATRSPGLSFHSADSLTSALTEHTNKVILENEMLQFNSDIKHTRACNIHLEEAAGDIHLPEEDTLISLNESVDPVASYTPYFAEDNKNEPFLPKKPVGDLNDNLLHAFLRDGECSRKFVFDNLHFMHASREIVDPDGLYHHLQGKQAPQFPHQMFAHLDHPTYRNPQMKFLNLDAYPDSNMISHHSYNSSGPRFDPTIHHLMVQTVPVPGYLPPHYSIQGIPLGLPLSHPMNHMHGLSPKMDNLHRFSVHQRQPNHGDLTMGMPAKTGASSWFCWGYADT